jgi:anti-sigma B factor antagonist
MPQDCRHLSYQVTDGILVVSIVDVEIQGEEIASALRDELLKAHASSGCSRVIVDFQRTRYISSVAFWPLLSLHRKLQASQGRLIVCGLSPSVGDVFFTTRLISPSGEFAAPFGFEPDLASALRSMAKSS